MLGTISQSSAKVLPTTHADHLPLSTLEEISSIDESQLDDLKDPSKEELIQMTKLLARKIPARRSLDYLYGGVRYRKRGLM
ncbi:unnamed protein product [Rodentolepis nana]|uniref:FH2 domain-containing protein n=1 Tax=Rodentolepis nana TaxID=102285 RepID=A0A0R3T118_RODNA|nr:unnamed protein product [Rodentolepis nana]